MNKYSKFYPASSFPNKKYDLKRLENQVKGYYRDMTVNPYSGGVIIFNDKQITTEQFTKLDEIVASHDGSQLSFLQKSTSDRRRLKMQGLLAMAYDRTDLKPVFPFFQKYFNYINKELDGYIYYGAYEALIEKINADKEAGQPFAQVLNGVVTDGGDNEPDVLAFQFLISSIETEI